MTGRVEARLKDLSISLPKPVAPVANYVPFVRTGDQLYISGQVSVDASGGIKGIVGVDVDEATAKAAARLCGINLIAQMKAALGDLSRVKRVVKVLGMVNGIPTFGDHPKVINGCSDLFVNVFGDAGKHARSAVGMGSLPGNISVEIEVILQVDG
jgi:enamine deaminase RidA (YjgF/YER057c/UK114 family)